MKQAQKVINLIVIICLFFAPLSYLPKVSAKQPNNKTVDIVFVMDTSGSMNDEFSALCGQISQVVYELEMNGITVFYEVLGITKSRECATSTVMEKIPGGISDHEEDWGPAVRDLAVRYPWRYGTIPLIIPMSDEGPEDGEKCLAPGSDEDSIIQAVTAANANGVRVSPVVASGANSCVEGLMQMLAASTGGYTFYSTSPAEDLATGIMEQIEAVAADRDGDGLADDQDPAPDDPCQPNPQAICLPKQVCGLNNTPHWDDDQDGRTDEEIPNDMDDDGDGLVDEDVGGVDCPFPNQDCGINNHRNFDDDADGKIDEEQDNGLDDDGDSYIDEDIACACPAEQNIGQSDTPGIDDDLDFRKDEEADDSVDNDGDGCVDEDIGSISCKLENEYREKLALINELKELGYDESRPSSLIQNMATDGCISDPTTASQFFRIYLTEKAVREYYDLGDRAFDVYANAQAEVLFVHLGIIESVFKSTTPEIIQLEVIKRIGASFAKFNNYLLDQVDLDPEFRFVLKQFINSASTASGGLTLKDTGKLTLYGLIKQQGQDEFVRLTQPAIDGAGISSRSYNSSDVEAAAAVESNLSRRRTNAESTINSANESIQLSKIAVLTADIVNIGSLANNGGGTICKIAQFFIRLLAAKHLEVGMENALTDFQYSINQAKDIDDTAFGSVASLELLLMDQTALSSYQKNLLIRLKSDKLNAKTKAFFYKQFAQVDTDSALYEMELAKTLDYVKVGDAQGVQAQLENLSTASQALLSSFENTTSPIQAVYSEAAGIVSGFDSQFDILYTDAIEYDAEVVQLYQHLFEFIESPQDSAMQSTVLAQAEVVTKSIDEYKESLAKTGMMVASLNLPSIPVIVGHEIKEQVSQDKSFQVEINVRNFGPNEIENGTLHLYPGEGLDVSGSTEIPIEKIAPGSDISIKITLLMKQDQETGVFGASIQAGEYLSPLYSVSVKSTSTKAISRRSDWGSGIGFLILILVFSGTSIFVIFARKNRLRKKETGRGFIRSSRDVLLVQSGPDKGKRFNMINSPMILGRLPSCSIRLEEKDVSRQHASILFSNRAWYIQDLESSYGTFVNGKRIQVYRLQEGDQITIGDTTMIFHEGRNLDRESRR